MLISKQLLAYQYWYSFHSLRSHMTAPRRTNKNTENSKYLVISCVLDHASSWSLNKGWPTRWHLLYYILLNMFQTLIRPSSGASGYLCCVGWLEACWCYVAGLSVCDVVYECRLNHVEQYIIKQVSSSWSTFIQISRDVESPPTMSAYGGFLNSSL